jgi:ribonuclease T2
MHPLISLLRTLSLVSAYCSPKDLSTLSCHNTTALTSTCCSEYPGGLLLQTQYWLPSPGPAHSWTIHGLWPDFCNGTYPAYCDAAREYASPVAVLEGAGEHELLRYMRKYWKTNTRDGVDDEAFWKHEFDKHGTCMSTLEPRCYGKRYTEGIEEVQHFKATKKLFKRLDSFKVLLQDGGWWIGVLMNE